MNTVIDSIKKIYVITALGLKESVRKKLLLFLLICCILFTGTGAGCANACMKMTDGNLELQLEEQKVRIANMETNPEHKQKMLMDLHEEFAQAKNQGEKTFKNVLYVVIFSMIAFWLYLISALFTPFLALNDFQTRTHVLLLSKSLTRWEYLLGKFSSILTLMILNLLLMILSSALFLYLSLDDLGLPLLKSLLVFSQGLLVFASMVIFLTLVTGRLPGIILSTAITVITVVPAIGILNGDLSIYKMGDNAVIYALAYGLPQLAMNYFYALSFSVSDLDLFKDLHKIGNTSGMVSVIFNTFWFAIFWSLSIFTFNRKDLDT